MWALGNPLQTYQRSQRSENLNVWCAVRAGGIIGGHWFFLDEDKKPQTTSGKRYCRMITEFLELQIAQLDVNNMLFQQDGTSPHTARESVEWLYYYVRRPLVTK